MKIRTLLALALLAVMSAASAEAPEPTPVPTPTPAPVLTRDPNQGKRKPTPTPVMMETPVPRPNVVMLSFASVDIEADKKDVWVYFPNSEKNEGWYDMAFTLWAALPAEDIEEGVETAVFERENKETGEVEEVVYAKLFSSGLVEAGYCLQEVTLTQPVHAGTYDAIVATQSYYVETGLPTPNGANTCVTLNVG